MRVAELYRSVQGEGQLTGADSVFLRASGCNLRCNYCDTPFASWNPEGQDFSVDELHRQIRELAAQPPGVPVGANQRHPLPIGGDGVLNPDRVCRHVVITGGEPMLFAEMLPLCERLREVGLHVTIETAGTLYLPLDCDLMSISPKTANSTPDMTDYPKWNARHERTRHAPDVIRRLVNEYAYQIKFVVAAPADLDEIDQWLTEFPEIEWGHVWLMPEGVTMERLNAVAEWLEPRCAQLGFAFCPRRHIEWFGAIRGT